MPLKTVLAGTAVALLLAACVPPPPLAPPAAGAGDIIGPSQVTLAEAQAWATSKGATAQFVANAATYWALAPSHGGVRPEVAYAQSAKETGYGHYGGVITVFFNNSCGLKTTAGGADGDPNAHQAFPSWHVGIQACLDHLALYAGAPGYPRTYDVALLVPPNPPAAGPGQTPDPRHFSFILGRAPTIASLGTNWAPSPTYGTEIEAMIAQM